MELSKRKFILILFSIVLVSSIISGSFIYVLATTPSQTFIAEQGVYPSGPAYVIWRVDSTYYGKDQQGELKYSSSNVTAVFEDVRDDLSSGGIIFFKEATYLITTSLKMITTSTRDIWIEGSHAAILKAADGAGLDAVIEIRTAQKGNTIRGITIDANRANGGADRGIWLVSDTIAPCTWVDIIEVNFENCPIGIESITLQGGFQAEHYLISNCKFGLHSLNNVIGIYLNWTRAVRIHGSIFEDCQNIGILGNQTENVVLTNCHFDDNVNYAIYLDSCANWAVSNCFFEDTVNNDHVYLDAQSGDNTFSGNVMHADHPGSDNFHVIGQRNLFTGNTFFENPNGAFFNIIGDKNQVVGNDMQGSADYGILIDSAQYCTIANNFIGSCTYGILEQNAADYSNIVGNWVFGSVTGDIITIGANTEVHSSFNGTADYIT